MSDLQPDIGEVLQEEYEEDSERGVVDVCVKDVHSPVRTQTLPRKGGATRTVTVTTAVNQYLRADPRRGRVLVMSMDENLRVAFNRASAQEPTSMSVWPPLVPLEITAAVDLWLASGHATDPTVVSITTETWAEGC